MSIRTIARRDSLVIASFDRILIAAWTEREATIEHIETGVAAAIEHAKAMRGVAIMIAVHPKTPLPAEPVRAAIQRTMRKLDPYLCCGATVIARDGFAGSAMRALSSTLQLLSRPTHPEKIVATARDGAAFIHRELSRQASDVVSIDDIVRAFDALTSETWGFTSTALQGIART